MLWNLRLLRSLGGYSQTELGRAAHSRQARISALELGHRPSNDAEVERIAQALKVAPSVLVAREITISRTGRVWRSR